MKILIYITELNYILKYINYILYIYIYVYIRGVTVHKYDGLVRT